MSAGLHLVLQLLHILESLVDNASCQHRLVIVPPEAKESLKQMEAQTFSHSLQLIHGSIWKLCVLHQTPREQLLELYLQIQHSSSKLIFEDLIN